MDDYKLHVLRYQGLLLILIDKWKETYYNGFTVNQFEEFKNECECLGVYHLDVLREIDHLY